jgi:hypothetical protein
MTELSGAVDTAAAAADVAAVTLRNLRRDGLSKPTNGARSREDR